MGRVTQRDKQENWAILVCRRERENWDPSELRCCFSFSVPENPPANVTAKLNGTEVLVMWEQPSGKLNGQLQGYMVEYSTPATQQVRNTFTVNKVAKFTNAWRKCPFFLIMTDRFFLSGCHQYRLGHWVRNQSVCPPVQCLFPSVCLYRGGSRTLGTHSDSDTQRSWWVTKS